MEFMVLSRDKIEHYNTDKKHIVISVSDPGYDSPMLPENLNRVGILCLYFHDVNDSEYVDNKEIKGFDRHNAIAILNFFETFRDYVDLVICQCEAGISRSSAIAGALCKISGQDDSKFFKEYLPNSFVYNSIIKEYYEGGEREDEDN